MPEKRTHHADGKTCSCCQDNMPRDPAGHDVVEGWRAIRDEKHGRENIEIRHYLLCPCCSLTFIPKQTTLRLATPVPAEPMAEKPVTP